MGVFGPVIRVPSDQSTKIVNKFDCLSGVAAGDLVIPSLSTANQVDAVANNTYNGLCIGVVINKPTATTCNVITIGLVEGLFSGLTIGKPVFVSSSGGLTNTPPTINSLQLMGYAVDTTVVFIHVNFNKTVRI